MKKKAIKIAASTAVAASAFVAAAPAQQADAAVNVNQLVSDAQNAGTVLKWAISVEGTADYKTQPMAQYNAAKKAIAAAEKAAAGLSASEKLNVDAKLVEPKLQVKRAAAYIDAISSSVKIKELTASLAAAIKTDDIEKVEKAYHTATAEYRKQAVLLDRVYGQSTRDGIRNEVKPAIEKLVASVKNEVTVSMLAKAAAADVKANKLVEAGKKIAEAQAILDANVLTWEAALQKSVDDVLTALPLTLTSVARVNDTTVVVTLNKEVAGVTTSEFSADNGLVITNAVLSADKKSVTLTTSAQAEGKTYVVSYRGTSVSFVTAPASVGNIAVITDDIHAETGQNVAVVATLKEKGTGLPSRNQVVDVVLPEGLKLVSANGVTTGLPATLTAGVAYDPSPTVNPTTTGKLTTDNNGQLILVVTNVGALNDTAVGGAISFTKANGETQDTGAVNFYELATTVSLDNATGVVEYVDNTNNYAVVDGDQKIVFKKSGDVFQVAGSVVALDAFKAKLSAGDVLNGQYNKDTASVINLAFDKAPTKSFTLTQKVVGNTTAYRQNGNTVLFSGNGEVGKTIAIYAGDNTGAVINPTSTAVAQTVVKSDGTWSVSVGYDAAATAPVQYAAYQHTTNTALPVFSATTGVKTLPVVVGNYGFASPAVLAPLGLADSSLIGDTLTLTTPAIAGVIDNAVVASNATITVKDFDGTTAQFVHGDASGTTITAVGGVVTVKFGSYTTLLHPGTVAGLSGTLQITDVTGVTNDYGLKVDVLKNGVKTITGY